MAPGQATEDTPSAPFQLSSSIALDEKGGWIASILLGTHIKGQCGLPGLSVQEFDLVLPNEH